jgi:exodeoxyribonuclease-3
VRASTISTSRPAATSRIREINPKLPTSSISRGDARHSRRCGAGRFGAILVGDLNIAPLETDVWSHKQLLKVVSHTPVETETLEDLRKAGGWVDLMRSHIPPDEKIFTWWSYRARDWDVSDRGRRLDHVWGSADLKPALKDITVLREARGWEKPSDHVPVIAQFAFRGRSADARQISGAVETAVQQSG